MMTMTPLALLTVVYSSALLPVATSHGSFHCYGLDDDCCLSHDPCFEGDGDCDSDDQCYGWLVCGEDNCPEFAQDGRRAAWNKGDDCCMMHICRGVDDGCCTSDRPCLEGGGDCDSDSHCYGSLVCGVDNCTEEGFEWDQGDDCCYREPCLGSDSCCSPSYPCSEGEGDCDEDEDCLGDLKCGSDNCEAGILGREGYWDGRDDCCH